MSLIELIVHNNIEHKSVLTKISNRMVKASKFVYITSTKSIKNIRSEAPMLKGHISPYAPDSKESNLFSISEFLRDTSQEVYADGGYLSNADQRFILAKTIAYKYKDNQALQTTIYRMRHDVYDLFKLLTFYGKNISLSQIDAIRKDYSDVDADIFDLYAIYAASVEGVIGYIKTGTKNKFVDEILGGSFLKKDSLTNIDLFINRHKAAIEGRISKFNAIFMDGFLFFDDMQKFILTSAVKQGKKVYLVSKVFPDKSSDFLFEESIIKLAAELGQTVKMPESKSPFEVTTALEYAKTHFPITDINLPDNVDEMSNDGTIRIITPFINRETELRYIVQSISNRLEDAYDGDTLALKHMLENDIAVVVAIEKEKYEERISNLFREIGMFLLLTDTLESSEFANIDRSTLEKIYFRRSDFISSDIHYPDGTSLNFNEKHILFEKCYSRIEINKTERPIATYPIGQFVLEVYNIIRDGISKEGFRNILYSNWRYFIDTTEYKWSNFISDFKYIEIYLNDRVDIQDWILTVNEISELHIKTLENPMYEYHPIKQISEDSLAFFLSLLTELNFMISTISKVFGSIEKHLDTLKSVVMKADKLIGADDESLQFEQVIIKRLVSAISDIAGSSLVNTVDAKYFAENIRAMLYDWENQNQEDEDSRLRLNVVNLENMKHYKHSYFFMCEMNKYPRRYFNSFPYSKEVLEIMADDKYGITVKPNAVFGMNYHLKLERYLFKNVLDFTTESITFTLSEKEAEQHNKPSIFLEDLATLFGTAIKYTEPETINSSDNLVFTKPMPVFKRPSKEHYTLTELAIYKLCPRLYFHKETSGNGVYLQRIQLQFYFEAILYCDLFRRFMEYNLTNEKVYKVGADDSSELLEKLAQDCFEDNSPYFSFLTKYEQDGILRNAMNKIKGFIENGKQHLSAQEFTIIPYQNKSYKGSDYELIIEHDNRYVDYAAKTWRMSQNSSYLEFLVLKTSDRKSELKHYADMISALDTNAPGVDRINLISRIIAKINIQFDSRRFAMDGIARTNELVRQIRSCDFGQANTMSSDYCKYCRISGICMEN